MNQVGLLRGQEIPQGWQVPIPSLSMTLGQTPEGSASVGRSVWQHPTPTHPAAKIQGHPRCLISASPVPAQKPSSPRLSRDLEQLEPEKSPKGPLRLFPWIHTAHITWPSMTPARGCHPPPGFLRLPAEKLGGDGVRAVLYPPPASRGNPFPPPPLNCRKRNKTIKSLYISPRVTKLGPRFSLFRGSVKIPDSSVRETLRQK